MALLENTEYPDNDCSTGVKVYSRQELFALVQASEQEILDAMKKHHIIEIDHKMKLLNKSVMYHTISSLLNTIIEYSWDYHALDERVLLELYQSNQSNHDPHILQYVLQLLGSCTIQNNNKIWNLRSIAVQQHAAHVLFRQYYDGDRTRKVS